MSSPWPSREPQPIPLINQRIPSLSFDIYHEGEEKKISFDDVRGKWLILFFYPADFTFICPTELEDLANIYDTFVSLNTEIISVSADTVFVHKAWHDQSPAIQKVRFPMAADPTGAICKAFGTYIEAEGLSYRATFLIDPNGKIKVYELHDNSIGRNAGELVRKLQAAQYVRDHGGEVCPAQWRPGEKTLRPGMDLVGKI